MRLISLLALSVALTPTPALAQVEPENASASAEPGASAATIEPTAEDDDHHDHHDDIVVTGVRRRAGDALAGLSVLDSEELAKELRPSLGEDPQAAARVMASLDAAGVSMTQVAERLLAEGVTLFADAFDKLLAAVAKHGG